MASVKVTLFVDIKEKKNMFYSINNKIYNLASILGTFFTLLQRSCYKSWSGMSGLQLLFHYLFTMSSIAKSMRPTSNILLTKKFEMMNMKIA